MYKFSKLTSRQLLTAVLVSALGFGLVATSATAGIEEVKAKKSASKNGKTKPTEINSMARIPDKVAGGNKFKCWQEGRLIFSRSGVDIGEAKLPGATQINGGGKSLQVLDLKQGMCILDQSR